MKVGYQRIDHPEFKRGIDELLGPARLSSYLSVFRILRSGLQGSDRGGPHRDYPLTFLFDPVYLLSRGEVDLEPFRRQGMIFRMLHPHRPEAVPADVQGNGYSQHTLSLDPFQKFRGEVKPCGRCRHGPGLPGIDGLVGTLVICLRLSLYVRGKRHPPDSIQNLEQVSVEIDLCQPASRLGPLQYLAVQAAPVKCDQGSLRHPLCGLDQNLPESVAHLLQEENLNLSVVFLIDPEDPGRKDLGLVDDQSISLLQVVDHLMEEFVVDPAALPVQDQKPRMIPLFSRILGDQIFGKRVVVVFQRNAHFLNQRKNAVSKNDRTMLTMMQVTSGKWTSTFFFSICMSPGSFPNTPALPRARTITPTIIRQSPKPIRTLAKASKTVIAW